MKAVGYADPKADEEPEAINDMGIQTCQQAETKDDQQQAADGGSEPSKLENLHPPASLQCNPTHEYSPRFLGNQKGRIGNDDLTVSTQGQGQGGPGARTRTATITTTNTSTIRRIRRTPRKKKTPSSPTTRTLVY